MTNDEIIALLDKHTDKACGYLRDNGEDPDLDTRTVIWNQMSALLAEWQRLAAPTPATGDGCGHGSVIGYSNEAGQIERCYDCGKIVRERKRGEGWRVNPPR